MNTRARPTPELMSRLYRAKKDLHLRRTQMSLKEKVGVVLELQRACFPLLKRQRAVASWEHPWEIRA